MAMVKISVIGMGDVVRGLEQGIETLRDAQSSFNATLDQFDLGTWQTSKIGWSVTWAVDALPGVRRRLAMAQALEGTNPQWVAGTVVLDESKISTRSPEQALQAGKDAAAALRDGSGKPDDELLAKLTEGMNDPYFSSGFASGLSPAELADIVVGLSYARTPADGYLDAEALAESNAWYGPTVDALSTTLGTATRATGELALPSGYSQSWVAEITAEVPTNAQTPDGTGRVDHANALGVLLGTGDFSVAFLGTVSEGVYDYERQYQEDHNGAVWAPRSADLSSGYGGVYDANGQIFRDPMAGVMNALGKSSAAAQNFFSGGDTKTVSIDGKDRVVNDRLAYLVQDRTWDVDPSNGGSLGSALEAATTEQRNTNGTGFTSAEIASQTFALIGDKTGDGADGGFLGLGADDGWKMSDGMRLSVAHMLTSYSADVYRVAIDGSDDLGAHGWSMLGSGDLFDDDMPYGATVSKDLVEKIIRTLGEDKENFTPFLAGMYQASNLAMDYGLKQAMVEQTEDNAGGQYLTGVPLQSANSAITNSAIVTGWALNEGYGGDKDDEALQKKRMEAIADALSLVSTLPFVPEIKPKMLKWGLDQVKDETVSAIKESAPSDAGATYEGLDQLAQDTLRDDVANLLLQNGYLDDEALAGARKRGTVITPYPPGAVTTSAGGELTFNTESKEYKDWMNSSPLATILARDVVGTYRDQWGVVEQ